MDLSRYLYTQFYTVSIEATCISGGIITDMKTSGMEKDEEDRSLKQSIGSFGKYGRKSISNRRLEACDKECRPCLQERKCIRPRKQWKSS